YFRIIYIFYDIWSLNLRKIFGYGKIDKLQSLSNQVFDVCSYHTNFHVITKYEIYKIYNNSSDSSSNNIVTGCTMGGIPSPNLSNDLIKHALSLSYFLTFVKVQKVFVATVYESK